ncbi:MAG TPA: DUF6624 domain-containing protein [Geodermatophilus sp.]|nr:DUF6624 domain-containing protein [Geodermatophilus sp.]
MLPATLLAAALLSGCSAGSPEDPVATRAPAPAPAPGAEVGDPALREELLAMLERDQAGRTGGADPEGDPARTRRLAEILDEHGWPGRDLVGEDGSEAAWAIAQHSDLDPAFQRRALELLRQAVAAGRASAGDLAYLTDRVATGAGEPQTFGTQVACTPDGPQPATPLVDAAGVERLRAEAGLPSYADYLAEMAAICAEE